MYACASLLTPPLPQGLILLHLTGSYPCFISIIQYDLKQAFKLLQTCYASQRIKQTCSKISSDVRSWMEKYWCSTKSRMDTLYETWTRWFKGVFLPLAKSFCCDVALCISVMYIKQATIPIIVLVMTSHIYGLPRKCHIFDITNCISHHVWSQSFKTARYTF